MAKNWKNEAATLALQLVELDKAVEAAKTDVALRDATIARRDGKIEELLERNAAKDERLRAAEEAFKKQADSHRGEMRDLRDRVDRLKEELNIALNQVERQQGYIDRTLEDDHVREVGVVSERTEAPRSPRHGPPPLLRRADFLEVPEGMAVNRNWDQPRRPPRPWFTL